MVISNCVINLSPDKRSVFSEIFRVLKPGGELYFSDVFSDRRVPDSLKSDPVLYGECLAGAMYIEDFRRMLPGPACSATRQAMKDLLLSVLLILLPMASSAAETLTLLTSSP